MKFRSVALALAILALCSGSAFAATGMSEFGINAGVALPNGDFSKISSTGFFGGATYCYHVNEMLGVGGDVNYHKFGKKDVTGGNYDYSIINYGVHGKYFFKLKTSEMPYVKVGLGMYSLSAKVKATVPILGTVSSTATDTKFGFNAGVGADWKINDKNAWGIEALYHNISTDGKTLAMITVGASYSWMMGK
jgi:outer membrane protein W